jgi:hypothetical protein
MARIATTRTRLIILAPTAILIAQIAACMRSGV